MTESQREDVVYLGSFCARAILENGCAAIYGRLDTFRLIYLSKFQSSAQYDPSKRAKTSFAWTGDVVTEEKPSQEIWSVDYDLQKISRSLLSKYSDTIFWIPAVNRMLDYIDDLNLTEEYEDLVQFDAGNFISEIKGKATRLYSELSKGVHWEFFSYTLTLDLTTVQVNIKEVIEIIAKISLVSHFIPTSYASLPARDAMIEYKRIKEVIQWWLIHLMPD